MISLPAANDPYATRRDPYRAIPGWPAPDQRRGGYQGQGQGPRTDTIEYEAKQWVGEGQGDPSRSDVLPLYLVKNR